MTSIDIFAEFDFLPKEIIVGRLDYERIKGEATYLFEYSKDFLRSFPGTILSRDIGLYEGKQACSGQIFSFLGDVSFRTGGGKPSLTREKGLLPK